MILNINEKINYFKSLIVYSILAQVFSEILQFQQYYQVNNVVKITIIITTITIVILRIILYFMCWIIYQHYSMTFIQTLITTMCKNICYQHMAMKYLNGVSFYEFSTLMYYIITYVIAYAFYHYLHQDEYQYDFILAITTICYLSQRLDNVIQTQWFISKFDHIGHALNTNEINFQQHYLL